MDLDGLWDELEKLPDKIRQYRKSRFWSFRKMSSFCSVSKSQIQRLENGVNQPTGTTLRSLIRAFPQMFSRELLEGVRSLQGPDPIGSSPPASPRKVTGDLKGYS